jgi:hypothetical protein
MKSSYPKTNDYRLIGHIAKHFKVTPADSLQELFSEVDSSSDQLPIVFQDLLVVYETFPVFGEFMFPKRNSYLWSIINSTDAPLLLTDNLIQNKEGIFICCTAPKESISAEAHRVLNKLGTPSLCVNTFENTSALLYPLVALQ